MKHRTIILALTLCLLSLLASGASAAQRELARVDDRITTGAALSGNTILFGDANGKLTAVGDHNWRNQDSDSTATGVPAVSGGFVVFAQLTGEVTCLNIADGTQVWQYIPKTDEYVNEGLNDGVSIGDGRVYAAFTSGALRAFDLKTGRVLWTYQAEQGLRTAPLYSNGLVFQGEYDGIFSMLDAKSGKRLNGGGAGGAINTPAVNGGNVYYTSWDGSIHAVQIKDVIPLWDANVKAPIATAPSISGGLIVGGTATGKIFALNEKDGSLLWEHSTNGGAVPVRPVISGNRVIAGTGDGRVVILNAETGKLTREYEAAYSLNTASGSTFFYVSKKGELLAID